MATNPRLSSMTTGTQSGSVDLGKLIGDILGPVDVLPDISIPFLPNEALRAVSSANDARSNLSTLNNTINSINSANDSTGDVLGMAGTNNTGYSNNYTAEDVAYLEDQASQFQDLLNRLSTTREQGTKKIENEYGRQVDLSNTDKQNQYAQYEQQRAGQLGDKATNYSAINQAGNKGYRSLADILGRASGTGSSVFQQLLPSIIGKDISAKRSAANTQYGKNMQNIQSSQNAYDVSFQRVLDDLAEQKRQNEEALLSGIEEQRQSLLPKLGTIQGQLASARGGGYAEVRAAQKPYADQLRASNDAVSGLFDKYFRPYTPSKAVAPAPELGTYTMDRSQINAANTNNAGVDPYAALLRKRLQENQ